MGEEEKTVSESYNNKFGQHLKEELISYGTGRYNSRKLQRLSERTISQCFASLDYPFRNILFQRYQNKKTLREIGEELDISPQGVRYHETKALNIILQSALRKHTMVQTLHSPTPKDAPLIVTPCTDRRLIKNVLPELNPRIIKCLNAGGYRTMKQLCCATPNNLSNVYGIGRISLKEIQQAAIAYHAENEHFFRHEPIPVKGVREIPFLKLTSR
jgi:hypothetical protein